VKPYEADEVYRTLAIIAPYDWKGFFEKRLQAKTAAIPLGGVEAGGYKLVYTEAPNMFTDPWALDGSLNAYGSLGIHVTADGTVDDAWQGMPAFVAGVTNGTKIIAVNARRFSHDELERALRGSRDTPGPIELIVENGGYFKTVRVDYHDGLRYPHLERTATPSDVLTAIAKARQ
jgi:predicted metalloprotease with PDZ domain